MDDTPDTFVRRRPMLLPTRLGELLLLLRSFEGRIPFLDVCYVEMNDVPVWFLITFVYTLKVCDCMFVSD